MLLVLLLVLLLLLMLVLLMLLVRVLMRVLARLRQDHLLPVEPIPPRRMRLPTAPARPRWGQGRRARGDGARRGDHVPVLGHDGRAVRACEDEHGPAGRVDVRDVRVAAVRERRGRVRGGELQRRGMRGVRLVRLVRLVRVRVRVRVRAVRLGRRREVVRDGRGRRRCGLLLLLVARRARSGGHPPRGASRRGRGRRRRGRLLLGMRVRVRVGVHVRCEGPCGRRGRGGRDCCQALVEDPRCRGFGSQ